MTAGLNKGEARNALARAVFFNRLDARLLSERGVSLRVEDAATLRLVALAYPEHGPARPPAAVVQRELGEPAETLIRSGRAKPGDQIRVDLAPGGFRFRTGALRR